MKNLPLRVQLFIGFGSILFMLLFISFSGYVRIKNVENTMHRINDVNSVKQRYAINFRGSVHDRAITVRDMILTDNTELMRVLRNDITRLEKFYADSAVLMDEIFTKPELVNDEERAILKKIKEVEARTMPKIARLQELIAQNAKNTANELLIIGGLRADFIEWLAVINEFIDYEEESNQGLTAKAMQGMNSFLNTTLWLVVISVIIALVVGGLIVSGLFSLIGGEPKAAISAVNRIAKGDLSTKIATKYNASMLHSVAQMQKQLKEIVRDVSNSSGELNEKSNAVSHSSKQALSAADMQVKSSEQSTYKIASTLAAVENVNKIAEQTEINSGKTTELAAKGKEAMNITIEEIEKVTLTVNESSEKIAMLERHAQDISGAAGTIKDIADQTNLLALNAAIEAARAGEHGRGFAVVADEVRKLSEKTASATNEIARMISVIQNETQNAVSAIQTAVPQVEKGMHLASEASGILDEINFQAQNSLQMAKEVASAAASQAESMRLLEDEISQISQGSKSTAVSMQDNTKAANSLKEIAEVLREKIAFFKI